MATHKATAVAGASSQIDGSALLKWFSGSRGLVGLSLTAQGLILQLSNSQSFPVGFDSVKHTDLAETLLWVTIRIDLVEGDSYVLRSFRRGDAQLGYRRLINHRSVSKLRANWDRLASASLGLQALLETQGYLRNRALRQWQANLNLPQLPDLTQVDDDMLTAEELEVISGLREWRRRIERHNNDYVARESARWANFLDTIESHPLTPRQKEAVLHDEENVLVLAGAGTGKTSTIIAKVCYLIQAGLAKPEEILLLSFTRNSAEEMRDRIRAKLDMHVEVRTFHSLGLEIIAQVENRKPLVALEATDEFALKKTLKGLLESLVISDEQLRDAYQIFVANALVPYRSPFDFKTEGEYLAFLKAWEMRALSGDRVKSHEELEIANWLYLNGIPFLYECQYEYDTATSNYRQYQPDFYLPDYKLYLEHFGIRRDGSTAPFVDRQKYHEGMNWKRALHKQFGTKLVETYSWMKEEGTLLSNLEAILVAQGVELNPLPPEEVLKKFHDLNLVDPLINLLSSFLKLYKGSCATEDEVLKKVKTGNRETYARNQTFLKIFLPLLHSYEEKNRARKEIDFDDMIRQALDHVESKRYQSNFRYILVDEFQDIAQGRARLIRELRKQVDGSQLFCVGDDWQAIYRFAGSDLSLVTSFSGFFGYTKTIALDRTFRLNNEILNFSTRFIMKNKRQLRKDLTPHTTVQGPAVELLIAEREATPYYTILQSIAAIDPQASVFILGRYNHTIPGKAELRSLRAEFPTVKLEEPLTIHKAKGLEADYVIVNGLKQGRLGFPAEIADDPVLDMLLVQADEFEHGEERRLFYVAVTRARKKVFLVGDKLQPSVFVKEIQEDPGYNITTYSRGSISEEIPCSYCGTGVMMMRSGLNGSFAGCSNYPYCTYTQNVCESCGTGFHTSLPGQPLVKFCTECGDTVELCPECQTGTLHMRDGRFGPFIGCSNYFTEINCRYTQDV